MPNPLTELQRYGQSVWLDYIRRSLITGGELRRLLDEDGLRGVTSNPAIFEKAIAGSTDYELQLRELTHRRDLDAKAAYELLAVHDIQDVADILRPIHESTGRRDGYVSLEVSPDLAHDTQGTLAEARRLWKAVSRDNVMIKVPATAVGIPAIEALIGEGINVNVTLLFAVEAYEAVAQAYLAGLEAFAARGGCARATGFSSTPTPATPPRSGTGRRWPTRCAPTWAGPRSATTSPCCRFSK
jgi:transaldolase / glucose-6-phosphate isomerase